MLSKIKIMNILKEIWKGKLSDYKVMDIIAKIWITVLLFMFLLGFIMVMYGIISGEADIQNATFGIFDTLG
jgi:cbb3-type cytochrome oxidase subunit 3